MLMKQYYLLEIIDNAKAALTKERHLPTWLVGSKPPAKAEDDTENTEGDSISGLVRPICSFLVFAACYFAFHEGNTYYQKIHEMDFTSAWTQEKRDALGEKEAYWDLAGIFLFILLFFISRVTQMIVLIIVLMCFGVFVLNAAGDIFNNLRGRRR